MAMSMTTVTMAMTTMMLKMVLFIIRLLFLLLPHLPPLILPPLTYVVKVEKNIDFTICFVDLLYLIAPRIPPGQD